MIVIASYAAGLIITLQLKYGPQIEEHGTVVMKDETSIYITHRDSPTTVYPNETAIIKIEENKPCRN